MKKVIDTLLLAKRTVTDPAGAAAALSAPGASYSGPLAIFLVSGAMYALLLFAKPDGFPAELAEAAAEFSDKSYLWLFLANAFSTLAFTAVLCAVFPLFHFFLAADRKVFFGLLAGSAVCGIYAAAAFYSKRYPALASPVLLALFPAAYIASGRRVGTAAAFFRFILSASAVELICAPVSLVAAAIRSEQLFLLTIFASALWTLVLILKAVRALYGATVVRAFISLTFSTAASALSFYFLKNLGLVPGSFFRFMLLM